MERGSLGKAVVETIGLGVALAAALFVPAGSLVWPMAWVVVVLYAACSVAAFIVLPRELIEERSRLPADTKPADLVIAGLAFLFLLPISFIVCGLDRRLHWSPAIPSGVKVVALAGFAFGYCVSLWAAHANPFFSSVVRVQRERGHHVIAAGPYAWVRHPGYAGGMAGHLLLPLALNSVWGLAPAVLGCVFLALRIEYEERVLRENLSGYAEYAERVRWRLIRGLW